MSADAYIPLNDRPQETPDARNAARLRRVRESLTGLLAQLLRAKQRNNGALPDGSVRCIGLFGGLGQGKSSVVGQALAELKKDFPKIRCYPFNVSDYAASDLTRDFDRIVGMWRSLTDHLWSLLLRAIFVFLVVFLAIFLFQQVQILLTDGSETGGKEREAIQTHPEHKPLTDGSATDGKERKVIQAHPKHKPLTNGSGSANHWWNQLARLILSGRFWVVFAGALLFSLRGPLRFWHREFERRLHTQSQSQSRWKAMTDSFKVMTGSLSDLWHCPNIIVIDDLDRATVAQQRAMLRSIHRFSQRMPYLFIICMDENLLLREAKPDPESPVELLRKVIQVELRLPARVPEDAVPLGLAVISEAARVNPALVVLKSPLFQADFCLLLSLLSGFGPRLAKRLLNDALLQAQTLGVLGNAEDCAALARLHLCLAEFPELRGHPHRLTRLLEGRERFDDDARQLRFDELNRRCAQVQPLDNDWRRLVGAFGETRNQDMVGEWPGDVNTPLSLVDSDFWESDTSRQLWMALEGVRLGYGERQIDGWKPFAKRGFQVSFEALEGLVFVHLMVMLANTREAAERLRLFDYASRRLEKMKTRISNPAASGAEVKNPEKHNALKRAFEFLDYALLRAWLADREVMAMLPDDKKEMLIRGLREQNSVRLIYLLPLLEDGAVPAADLLEALFGIDAGMSRFDVHLLRRWLRGQRRVLSEPVRVFSMKIPGIARVALLNEIWPPLPPAAVADSDWINLLRLHLRRWRELSVVFPELRPNSLVAWLATPDNWRVVIQQEHQARVLSALRGFFEYDGIWRADLWRKEWIEPVIGSLLDPAGLDGKTWEVALLLACLSGDDKVRQRVGIRAIESPGLARLLCGREVGGELWACLPASELGCLFNGLTKTHWRIVESREWEAARAELRVVIPDLVSTNADKYAIFKLFNLNPMMGGT